MLTTNISSRFKSISIDRINEYLTQKGIECKCTELKKISFILVNWHWDIHIDDDYFNMTLVFPMNDEGGTEKLTNSKIAEKACLEVTQQLKVLKSYFITGTYRDEENENKLIRYQILHFGFESFCYNMYDFDKLFSDGVQIILGGLQEYRKHYDEIETQMPTAPIGFMRSDDKIDGERTQTTNRHIGFV